VARTAFCSAAGVVPWVGAAGLRVRLWQIVLGCRTKILRAADAFYAQRRVGPYRFIQNPPRGGTVRGSCLCGEVEFQLIGNPTKIYQCHCSLCRKQGGSSSNSAILAEGNNFRWISGQEKISSYVKPTGFRSDFCSRCGSPVPNPLRTTSYYWVPAGLLDDNVSLEVGAHLFIGSKASWDATSSSVPQYETMPALSEFFELMHSRS